MNDHPNACRLDGLAAGGADPDAARHLIGCALCTRYVDELREALVPIDEVEANDFVASLADRLEQAPPVSIAEPPATSPALVASPACLPSLASPASLNSSPSPRSARRLAAARPGLGPRTRLLALTAGPLLAAAALLLLVLRPLPLPSPPGPNADANASGSVRFKGELALAVIRERGGEQERLVHEASVRAGDRIRLEVGNSVGGPLLAGVLADDGAWLPLLEAPSADVGTHFSERSARFDDEPTEGFVLAGRPDEVDRARTTRRFEGVATLRLRYERGP
jgi:hypothetical protein